MRVPFAFFTAWFLAALPAHAAPFRAVVLDSGELFQLQRSGEIVTCGFVSSRWASGTLSRGRFLSHAQAISNKRAALREAPEIKKARLELAIGALRTLQRAQNPVCRAGPPKGGGGPVKPGGTPTPRPTQAPAGNFDSLGNVTSKGKAAFGIPTNLSANVITGKSTHGRFACTSCHAEETGASFSTLKNAIATESSMEFFNDTGTDADIANIVAYLNRFKVN